MIDAPNPEIAAAVRKYLDSAVGPVMSGISNDARLLDDGVIDSFAVLDLMDFLEHQFEIKFEDKDVTQENFQSVVAITQLIEKYVERTTS